MKIWKTQDKNRYTKLEGMTVAIRIVNKIPKTNFWEGIDYERSYDIVQIQECKLPFFIDEEKNEYHIGDIIMIF
jgi:hypothetical protein